MLFPAARHSVAIISQQLHPHAQQIVHLNPEWQQKFATHLPRKALPHQASKRPQSGIRPRCFRAAAAGRQCGRRPLLPLPPAPAASCSRKRTRCQHLASGPAQLQPLKEQGHKYAHATIRASAALRTGGHWQLSRFFSVMTRMPEQSGSQLTCWWRCA